GGIMGSKNPIHPNEAVNMSHSTNDTFQSSMYIATALEINNRLLPALEYMQLQLADKANQWDDMVKFGSTHMQDAVPLTLGQ
ncbi:lyase family protein, partial [Francisella tularensis]|uniref:lyase family protein n=1 Tax=Francisella tularensis TaxID=263 RepID=UPI002381C011